MEAIRAIGGLFTQDNPIGWGIAIIAILVIILIYTKSIPPFTKEIGFSIIITAFVAITGLCLVAFFYAPTPATSTDPLASFFGTWKNQNGSANTFKKLIISQEDIQIRVDMVGPGGSIGEYEATAVTQKQLTIPAFEYSSTSPLVVGSPSIHNSGRACRSAFAWRHFTPPLVVGSPSIHNSGRASRSKLEKRKETVNQGYKQSFV